MFTVSTTYEKRYLLGERYRNIIITNIDLPYSDRFVPNRWGLLSIRVLTVSPCTGTLSTRILVLHPRNTCP